MAFERRREGSLRHSPLTAGVGPLLEALIEVAREGPGVHLFVAAILDPDRDQILGVEILKRGLRHDRRRPYPDYWLEYDQGLPL